MRRNLKGNIKVNKCEDLFSIEVFNLYTSTDGLDKLFGRVEDFMLDNLPNI